MALDRKVLRDLTAKMKQLGLPNPAELAREELESGEPILATYSFLTWLTGSSRLRTHTRQMSSHCRRPPLNRSTSAISLVPKSCTQPCGSASTRRSRAMP